MEACPQQAMVLGSKEKIKEMALKRAREIAGKQQNLLRKQQKILTKKNSLFNGLVEQGVNCLNGFYI